jgi:hypothetical protein
VGRVGPVRCPAPAVFGQTGIISAERGLRMLDRRPETVAALIGDFIGEIDPGANEERADG